MTQRRYIGVIALFNLALVPCTVAILMHILSFGPSEVRGILREWKGPLKLFIPDIDQRIERLERAPHPKHGYHRGPVTIAAPLRSA